jgi:hypothetical protein
MAESDMKSIQAIIEENRKKWSPRAATRERFALVDCGNRRSSLPLVGRLARAISDEKGIEPIFLFRGRSRRRDIEKAVLASFGFDKYIFLAQATIANAFLALRALLHASWHFLTHRSGDSLLQMKFSDLLVGDLIYDEVIRFTPDRYTIDRVTPSMFLYFFKASYWYLFLQRIFAKYDIEVVYCRLLVFSDGGIMGRLGAKHGAHVLIVRGNLIKNYRGRDIQEGQYAPRPEFIRKLSTDVETKAAIETYLKKRVYGDLTEVDAARAYKDKVNVDYPSLTAKLGLSSDRPCAILYCHAFSDGSHHTPADRMLYRDYYTWAFQTLRLMAELDNVNWFVKPHPLSAKYGEEGLVEKMVEDLLRVHPRSRVRILPHEVNPISFIDRIQAIITVTGKAALEYGPLGIPSIVAGQASYHGYGFSIAPKTIQEYREQLGRVHELPRLTAEQRENAKVLAAHLFLALKTKDLLTLGAKDNAPEPELWSLMQANIPSYSPDKDSFYTKTRQLLRLEHN